MKSPFFKINIAVSVSVFLIFSVFLNLTGQSLNDKILMTIGDHKISTEEFKRIYLKNSQTGESEAEPVTVDDYLDLFVKLN